VDELPLRKEEAMPVHLSERELATVLAALRYWQQDLNENQEDSPISPDHFVMVITPLTVEKIDELCQRLNCRPVTD
jgi:hypothetical protein